MEWRRNQILTREMYAKHHANRYKSKVSLRQIRTKLIVQIFSCQMMQMKMWRKIELNFQMLKVLYLHKWTIIWIVLTQMMIVILTNILEIKSGNRQNSCWRKLMILRGSRKMWWDLTAIFWRQNLIKYSRWKNM